MSILLGYILTIYYTRTD